MDEYSIYESAETYFRDLYKIECLIRKEIGEFSDIIRFPGGSGNSISNKYNKGIMASLANDVEDMGYVYYDWNASSGDGAHIDSSATLINAINSLNKPRDKYIILFHEKKSTIDIIELFIQHAQLMNFNFLPLLRNSYIVHGYQK